ncbi:hypothetical protein Tco_0295581 [Tanacetum coccineum]
MVINSPCLIDKKELAIPGQTTTGKEFSNLLMAGSLPKTIRTKFIDQHNMVVYLEKSDENAEFHHIVDFLSTSFINYALTQIDAIIDVKAVVISESSVRSDLLFDDEDGKVTLLFDSMLVQNQAPEGEGSAIPSEPQPTPSTSQPIVSEPPTESLQTKTPPTTVPQTRVSQAAVSQIVFHDAHIEQIPPSLTTYQRKRKTHKRNRYRWQSQAPRNHGGTPAQTRSERVLEQPSELPLPEGHTSGSREGSMEHLFELTDNVPPTPHDSPLIGGYTPGSDEGRMKLDELITLCTNLSKQMLDLEKEKDAQVVEILNLKKRVESFDDDLDEEDASKQGRRSEKTKPIPSQVSTARPTVSSARPEVSAASVPVDVSVAILVTPPTTTIFNDNEDLTIAQTLVKMRSEKAKEKEKGVAFRDEEETPRLTTTRSITTLQPLPSIDPKDKGKSVLVEEEPVKIKRSNQAERRQRERVAQEEATNAALAEEFDDIQARIDVDHELAVRLTHEEQEKYTIKERARLLTEFFERRKRQLEAERAKAIRNKPPTRTQLRNMMITYLKHMASMDVVPRDDVTIDVESLATKYLIVDWKTYILNENMMYYQIIRADGSSKNYKIFSEMLDDFDRQDAIDLYRLVNKRYATTSPEGYELLLWGDLKTLFKPDEEDEIWKNQQDFNLISWKYGR